MKKLITITLLLSAVFLYSCASSIVSPVIWEEQEDGVALTLYANKTLHGESDKSEPLNILVYQLSSPVSYSKLSESREGLAALQKGEVFDKSVTSVNSFKIPPGSVVTFQIDRTEGSSHVGVVAGYKKQDKRKIIRLYEIPVFIKKDNVFSSVKILEPGILEIKLVLASDGLREKIVKAPKIVKRKDR